MMDYSKLYPIVRKTPKPIRDLSIRAANKCRLGKVRRLRTPSKLVYFVTNRCNAKCAHCFYWKDIESVKKELTFDEVEKITKTMWMIDSLSLTGGEAIMRPDLARVMELFYKNNKTRKMTLPTNGSLSAQIKDLVVRAFDRMPHLELHIQISLDGMKEFHDIFRGVPGIFDKAVETAKMLKKMELEYPNLHTYVLTTVANSNYNEINPLIKFVKEELGIDHKFQVVRGTNTSVFNINTEVLSGFNPRDTTVLEPETGKLKKILKKLENLEYADKLYKKVQELKFRYSIDILGRKKPIVKCLAGRLDGVLYPDGEVALCEMTNSIGNVRDYGLNFEKLWNSEHANKMRKEISKCFCTHSCNLVNSMLYDTKTLVKLADNE